MTAEEEISQLRDRIRYYRIALQELAVMRRRLVVDGLRRPGEASEASLRLNEQTMAVIQRALEVSTTRLANLGAEEQLRNDRHAGESQAAPDFFQRRETSRPLAHGLDPKFLSTGEDAKKPSRRTSEGGFMFLE